MISYKEFLNENRYSNTVNGYENSRKIAGAGAFGTSLAASVTTALSNGMVPMDLAISTGVGLIAAALVGGHVFKDYIRRERPQPEQIESAKKIAMDKHVIKRNPELQNMIKNTHIAHLHPNIAY